MANNLSRRKFLQYLAGGASAFSILSPNIAFAITHKFKRDTGDFLSFAELEGLGPEINARLMDSDYVALHEERELPMYKMDQVNREYYEWLMREMVQQEGLKWDEADQLFCTYQYYGKCDHSGQCFKLLGYSRSAQDFLYDSVSGLFETQVNWNVLIDSFDYSKQNDMQFNGFIGRHTYLVNRINLMGADGRLKDFGLISATPVNRAINYITSKGFVLNASLMYLIPGSTSIVSPFSELLHLSTHTPSRRLAMQLRNDKQGQQADQTSHMIGEAITESAAILMAQQYLVKHHYDDRMSFVYNHANYLGSRFPLIPDVLAYMHKYGVQQTLQSYDKDPLYLINEINDSSTRAPLKG